MRLMRASVICVAVLALSACGDTGLRLLQKPGEGPDEFRIVPGKPLEAPQDYSTLPPPTPGAGNITDAQPLQDSVAALGGRRPVDASGPIPSSDGALVNQASRFGRDANVRTELAAEDEDFRRRRSRLTQIRIVKEDRYNQIYRGQALDAGRELERWRRAGARTPSAPPS